MSETQDKLIDYWLDAKLALANARKEESECRDDVINECFEVVDVGTNTYEMGDGVKVKAVKPMVFKVDPSFPAEWADSKVIRVKYEVDKKEYNKLSLDQQKEFQKWVTITYGKVQLSLA